MSKNSGMATEEATRGVRRDPLNHEVIGAAIAAHRELGQGLLEWAYEFCLCWALEHRAFTPVHQAQLLTYLTLSECHKGPLITFDGETIKDRMKRMVL